MYTLRNGTFILNPFDEIYDDLIQLSQLGKDMNFIVESYDSNMIEVV